MKNRNYKIQVLTENYKNSLAARETCEFAEWVKLESQSDPNFFRWLFEDENLQDFSAGEYADEFVKFCNAL